MTNYHCNRSVKVSILNQEKMRSKFHVLMFPWLAYGHFIPFLHLANKLAERGLQVSVILPESALLKLQHLNHHPHLIHLFPLVVTRVDGLPPAAETTSDVATPEQESYLLSAFDKTQDRVLSYVCSLKPDLVVHDLLAYWVPSVVRDRLIRCKLVCYILAATPAVGFLAASRKVRQLNTSAFVEEYLLKTPPGFPTSRIRLTRDEALKASSILWKLGDGVSFYERLNRCIEDSDAIAWRTCHEVEGKFCDYIAEQYAKPMLLTGLALPQTTVPAKLDDKWSNWLDKFKAGSVVYCAFGSQTTLQKDEFQELVLGLELTGLPFLVALKPPLGCKTVEEALPDGFAERVEGRGWVCGGWVPQPLILNHPSTGCFVTHGGSGSMWEALLSDCQIVLMPSGRIDLICGAKLMVEELEVAVEVERNEKWWIGKESLCKAIKLVMDKDDVDAANLKTKHGILRNILSSSTLQENYIDNFILSLHQVLESQA